MNSPLTHEEYYHQLWNKPARHCTAHDMMIGGACSNCGWGDGIETFAEWAEKRARWRAAQKARQRQNKKGGN